MMQGDGEITVCAWTRDELFEEVLDLIRIGVKDISIAKAVQQIEEREAAHNAAVLASAQRDYEAWRRSRGGDAEPEIVRMPGVEVGKAVSASEQRERSLIVDRGVMANGVARMPGIRIGTSR